MKFSFALLLVAVLALLACTTVLGQQGAGRDQVEAGVKHTKAALKSLQELNLGADPVSAKKIAKLNAPKIEYYHSIQKINDRLVDRTAREAIDNPERQALRAQEKADKEFVKTVSSSESLLNAHNALLRSNKGGKIRKL